MSGTAPPEDDHGRGGSLGQPLLWARMSNSDVIVHERRYPVVGCQVEELLATGAATGGSPYRFGNEASREAPR